MIEEIFDPDNYLTAGTVLGMIGVMACCIRTSWADSYFKLNHDIKTGKKGVHIETLTMAFMESFRTFFGEAIIKPWQPLGMGMFAPWISGNWKGALQQWLVIHLYLWTFELLATAYYLISWWEMPIGSSCMLVLFCFLLLVYGTWQFWFAITQRKPIGLPAFPVSFLFSIPTGSFLFLILFMSPNPFGTFGVVLGTCLGPIIGCLMTAFRVYELPSCVVAFGLCVMLLSGPVLLLFIPFLIESEHTEEWLTLIAFPVPIQIIIGICIMIIGFKGNGEQQDDAQAEVVGKRNVSKQSVSTAPTDEENPTADVAHVRDDP
jgi:hypothetical protein